MGWFKLNIDSSSFNNPRRAGSGVLLRNHQGQWISDFSKAISFAESVAAELWAFIRGCVCNPVYLLFQLDATVVVALMSSTAKTYCELSTLVADCRALLWTTALGKLIVVLNLQGKEHS